MPRKEINYQNTIIYKIVCNDLNIKDLYVGHTTDFRRRKNGHKSQCMNENSKGFNYKIYQIIRKNGGWDNWSIIEIEKYPCNDSNEATARERYWFETLEAKLNMIYPVRPKKEYLETNKEKRKYILSKYREANKDKIKELQKQYRKINQEQLKSYSRSHYEKNKDRITNKIREYNENNKDVIKERKRIYRQKNIEKIKERTNEKRTCECGGRFTVVNQTKHLKTMKHKSFIEEKEI